MAYFQPLKKTPKVLSFATILMDLESHPKGNKSEKDNYLLTGEI